MDTRDQSHRLIVATFCVIGQKLYGHSVVGVLTNVSLPLLACKILALQQQKQQDQQQLSCWLL